jgi:hypothetical protein
MSKSHIPPVPPAARSDKGPGDTGHGKDASDVATPSGPQDGNVDKRGTQGNIKQNTTHQGYQQDR